MTREQFEKLPEGPPFYDYINGEAVEVNRPSGRHQQIQMRVANVLWEYAQRLGLGEVFPDIDVVLPGGNTVGPDIAFVSTERLGLYDADKGDLHGTPDLIVEVLSPSTAAYDRIEKMALYEAANVRWIWLIDQDTFSVEELQWTPDGYLRVGAVTGGRAFTPHSFSDLSFDISELLGLGG
jgi:Uma2 family endonuclease